MLQESGGNSVVGASSDAVSSEMKALLKGQNSSMATHDLSAGAVVVEATRPPRFEIELQQADMLTYLDKHGYAVVAGVADDEAVTCVKSLMWDFLESVPNTHVRRNDVATWDIPGDWMPSETNGIIHGFGWGQSACMWKLRLLPRVKATFAAIWRTTDLLVSFDGGNAFRPWRYNRSWLTDGGWYHVDQNAMKPGGRGRQCVQGFVTLCDVSEETGGLVVVPGSHKQHTPMCERIKIAKAMGDFLPVPIDDPVLRLGARLICCKAGDLVLWDSRTVHCNTPALSALREEVDVCSRSSDRPTLTAVAEPASEEQAEVGADTGRECPTEVDQAVKWELIRQVGYVCMTPAKLAPVDVVKKRQDAFENNISLSHWPHKYVMAGHALPDTQTNDPSLISAEQRALIGYDREPKSRCAIS